MCYVAVVFYGRVVVGCLRWDDTQTAARRSVGDDTVQQETGVCLSVDGYSPDSASAHGERQSVREPHISLSDRARGLLGRGASVTFMSSPSIWSMTSLKEMLSRSPGVPVTGSAAPSLASTYVSPSTPCAWMRARVREVVVH